MEINRGRETCFVELKKNLSELRGQKGVTEILFRDRWLEYINSNSHMTEDGWYAPPPFGMGVLFGDDIDSSRLNFKSLRDEKSWPSDRAMNWADGIMYAYASNMDWERRLAGDLGVTLYFGTNYKIIDHYKNCFDAVKETIEFLSSTDSSIELFNKSQNIFKRRNLRNCISSHTDLEPLDLGHTIPLPDKSFEIAKSKLSDQVRNFMRNNRNFINSSVEWSLSGVEQFTVEPQLISTINDTLPKISLHYICSKKSTLAVMEECDSIIEFIDLWKNNG